MQVNVKILLMTSLLVWHNVITLRGGFNCTHDFFPGEGTKKLFPKKFWFSQKGPLSLSHSSLEYKISNIFIGTEFEMTKFDLKFEQKLPSTSVRNLPHWILKFENKFEFCHFKLFNFPKSDHSYLDKLTRFQGLFINYVMQFGHFSTPPPLSRFYYRDLRTVVTKTLIPPP